VRTFTVGVSSNVAGASASTFPDRALPLGSASGFVALAQGQRRPSLHEARGHDAQRDACALVVGEVAAASWFSSIHSAWSRSAMPAFSLEQ
jgi:methylase of polypeptide subunit release factors